MFFILKSFLVKFFGIFYCIGFKRFEMIIVRLVFENDLESWVKKCFYDYDLIFKEDF